MSGYGTWHGSTTTASLFGSILSAWIAIALPILLVALVISIPRILGHWKIFSKAKQPGWASIVPFYNSYILFKITWGCGWLFLAPIALAWFAGIPVLGVLLSIIAVIIQILTMYKLAVAFGKGIGFTIGLVLLNPIFLLILAFGSDQYRGIPQDGFSYKQLQSKVKSADAHSNSYDFEQPAEETTPDVDYENPNT